MPDNFIVDTVLMMFWYKWYIDAVLICFIDFLFWWLYWPDDTVPLLPTVIWPITITIISVFFDGNLDDTVNFIMWRVDVTWPVPMTVYWSLMSRMSVHWYIDIRNDTMTPLFGYSVVMMTILRYWLTTWYSDILMTWYSDMKFCRDHEVLWWNDDDIVWCGNKWLQCWLYVEAIWHAMQKTRSSWHAEKLPFSVTGLWLLCGWLWLSVAVF